MVTENKSRQPWMVANAGLTFLFLFFYKAKRKNQNGENKRFGHRQS